MRDIFKLTKREQRIVVVIVTGVVGFAFAKHFWQNKLSPLRTKATATPAAMPTVHPKEPADDSRD